MTFTCEDSKPTSAPTEAEEDFGFEVGHVAVRASFQSCRARYQPTVSYRVSSRRSCPVQQATTRGAVHPGISRAAAAHGEQSEPIGEVAAGSHEEQVSREREPDPRTGRDRSC